MSRCVRTRCRLRWLPGLAGAEGQRRADGTARPGADPARHLAREMGALPCSEPGPPAPPPGCLTGLVNPVSAASYLIRVRRAALARKIGPARNIRRAIVHQSFRVARNFRDLFRAGLITRRVGNIALAGITGCGPSAILSPGERPGREPGSTTRPRVSLGPGRQTGRGSLGRPSTRSPMMLRWIWPRRRRSSRPGTAGRPAAAARARSRHRSRSPPRRAARWQLEQPLVLDRGVQLGGGRLGSRRAARDQLADRAQRGDAHQPDRDPGIDQPVAEPGHLAPAPTRSRALKYRWTGCSQVKPMPPCTWMTSPAIFD